MSRYHVCVDRAVVQSGVGEPIIVRELATGLVARCSCARIQDGVILHADQPNEDGALVYIEADVVKIQRKPDQGVAAA